MTDTTDLTAKAQRLLSDADFDMAWPDDVRDTLIDAAMTEGDIPPYAVRRVEKALRVATAIEKRLNRDIEVGEASLSHAEKQRRGLASR